MADKSQIVRDVPVENLVVVDQKHPLAEHFFTTRNLWKPNPNLVTSLQNDGQQTEIHVWPWRDSDGDVQFIVVDGNQRTLAAKSGGIETLRANIHQDWTVQDAIKASAIANGLRKDNDFYTNMMVVCRLVNPDESGKPQGLSYEDVGRSFDKSHQWARNIVGLSKLPKKIKEAIQRYTTGAKGVAISPEAAAVAFLRKDLISNPEAIIAKFDELVSSEANMGGNGKISVKKAKAKAQGSGEEKMSTNEWRAIAMLPSCPEDMANLIQVFVGDKTMAWGRSQGLDFLNKPEKVKKGKKEKASKSGEDTLKPHVPANVSVDDLFS